MDVIYRNPRVSRRGRDRQCGGPVLDALLRRGWLACGAREGDAYGDRARPQLRRSPHPRLPGEAARRLETSELTPAVTSARPTALAPRNCRAGDARKTRAPW